MLIPAIDLQNGHVVQLVQGESLAIEARDPEPWITKFSAFPRVQVIDLDAAKGQGTNAAIVSTICGRLPCRVGGGIRSLERAQAVLGAGAHGQVLRPPRARQREHPEATQQEQHDADRCVLEHRDAHQGKTRIVTQQPTAGGPSRATIALEGG